jgi:rhamnogalacturonyl hydrolase YesR
MPASVTLPTAELLLQLETVADRQLAHPGGFDIFSHRPGDERWELTRVSWDGVVLGRRPCNIRPEPAAAPEAWRQLARLERDDAPFCALPHAAQSAWLKDTGLAADNITLIQMLDGSTRGWEMGVLYHGLLALDRISKKRTYRNALRLIAHANEWRLGARYYHADDHAVGYMYLDLHEEREPSDDRDFPPLADVQAKFDWVMRHPAPQPMTIKAGQRRWTWCDALFMSPPVWARLARVTGERAYLDFMDAEWWEVTRHLHSPADRLFFRDATFFDRRESNGTKVFWSRGNGWVLAALARVLDEMPADYASRPRYLELFRDLSARIIELLPSDALWRTSLLDPGAYPSPEVSGSAFFCYALAWGVNNGHLDRAHYEPVVLKTWSALQRRVQPDGHLGYIQQPAAAPGSAGPESTAPYGVGAFLLAGTEVHRMLSAK